METLKTAIEFVSNGAGGQGTAQTGDPLLIICVIAMFLCIAGLAFALIQRQRTYAYNYVGHHSIQAESTNNRWSIMTIVFAVLVALSMIGAIGSITANRAIADDSANKNVPEKIKAVVDDNTGAVTIEDGYIQNIGTDRLILKSVKVTKSESDGDCNYTLTLDGKEIFNDKADVTKTLDSPFAIESKLAVKISTDMNPEIAKSFIGKSPLTIEYKLVEVKTPHLWCKVVDEKAYIAPEQLDDDYEQCDWALNGIKTGTEVPPWGLDCTYIVVQAGKDGLKIRPNSLESWFDSVRNLNFLTGLKNIDTSNVTSMHNMFRNCGLETIDLTNFTIGNKVSSVEDMFSFNSNLKNIYTNTFDISDVKFANQQVFVDCDSLVGGNGTAYAEQPASVRALAKYGHIDGGETNPGYFKQKGTLIKTIDFIREEKIGGKTVQVQYYPVFNSVPEGVTFYNEDESQTYNSMNPEIHHAKAPEGVTIKTLRSIGTSWDDAFEDKYGGNYPYTAIDITETLKSKLVGGNEETEQVYRLNGDPRTREPIPKYEGVRLTDIWNTYKEAGFGGPFGYFWSSCANSSDNAYGWHSYDGTWYYGIDRDYNLYVLVFRAF